MSDLFLATGFWIKSEVKQPEEPGWYLTVLVAEGTRPEILYWSGSRWQVKGPHSYKVTHWAHICTPTGDEWR